ncbi:hypothetical protein QUF49_12740 [Fictibacillus sp. b24]|nr:hypothetical protein [Fictibacillus sp. b24]MDM5316866.1 hypothetical protein [Fictibacillus sp. b24]
MRDSCGTGGQVRHLKVKRTNVAHRPVENNQKITSRLWLFFCV